jgi:ATP-dependent RNA helicase DDX42
MKRGRSARGRVRVGSLTSAALDSAFSGGFSSDEGVDDCDDDEPWRTRQRCHAGRDDHWLRRQACPPQSGSKASHDPGEEGLAAPSRAPESHQASDQEGAQDQGKAPEARISAPAAEAGSDTRGAAWGASVQPGRDSCERKFDKGDTSATHRWSPQYSITRQDTSAQGYACAGSSPDAGGQRRTGSLGTTTKAGRMGGEEREVRGMGETSEAGAAHGFSGSRASRGKGRTSPNRSTSTEGLLRASSHCGGRSRTDCEGSKAGDSRVCDGDRKKSDQASAQDPLDAFMSTLDHTANPSKSSYTSQRFAGGLDGDSDGDDEKKQASRLDARGDAVSAGDESPDTAIRLMHCREEETSVEHGMQPAKDFFLPKVDHASMNYPNILKDIYVPLPRLSSNIQGKVRESLDKFGVHVSCSRADTLRMPLERFQDLALTLPNPLLGYLLTRYSNPTTVQRCVIPIALSGADLIAVAKTGSGKTAAYAIPLLAHVCSQNRRDAGMHGTGPTAIVIAPTRELAAQVSSVLRGFGNSVNIGVASVVGGVAKYEQFKHLRDGGASVIVCTPGRFIDMVRMKACSLASISFIVVDEADRMFGMGFGHQLHQVLSNVRPDAQKLFVSATFPKEVQNLASVYLSETVHLFAGRSVRDGTFLESEQQDDIVDVPGNSKALVFNVPLVSDMVLESYVIVPSESSRLSWLVEHLPRILDRGLVIVFCATRGGTAALANQLRAQGHPTACIHGETEASDRTGLMSLFRKGEVKLLVATDVAARGLDIDMVRTVVNYEPAKNWDEHVHRSGRTGRAGVKGTAYTLLFPSCPRDVAFARAANSALRTAKVSVPAPLTDVLDAGSSGFGARNSYISGRRGNVGVQFQSRAHGRR